MKIVKFRAPLLVAVVSFVLFAINAAGQTGTQAPAKKPAPAAGTRTTHMSYDPALLHPATLKAQAPEMFEVKFTTTAGDFVVQVNRSWAPIGADRFYNLVKHHFFDGAAFFRVIPGFIVQFGLSAFPQVNAAWQNANIKDEPVKQSNTPATITYAKAGPNSRTTQLFINYGNNGALDAQGFAAFGTVTGGMDVVQKIFSGYGEAPDQNEITAKGKAYLDTKFPKLDTIKSTTIISPAPAAGGATPAHPAPKPTPKPQ
ncbi:MAG: peptidylprolyl isomerase [Candidatus Acidiferrales bacterium]